MPARNAEEVRLGRKGIPFKTLECLSLESGILVSELASIVEKSLNAHWLAEKRLADWGETSPLRHSRIFEKAVRLFNGDVVEAVSWLQPPRRALANHTPLAYSATEPGAREVENLMGQVEHGVFP